MFETVVSGLRAGEIRQQPTDPDQDLVNRLRGETALVSHFQARMYETIAQISHVEGFDPEGLGAEVTVALRLTRAAGDAEYELALLLERFPRVRTLLAVGSIDLRRARVIVENLATLTDTQAEVILDRILRDAPELTTGQLRSRIRRLKLALEPDQARIDYHKGLEARRVMVEANPDGTANLYALNLAPERVMAIRRRLHDLARKAKVPGDTRTADQRRADVFCDLLVRGDMVGSSPGSVDIVVDLPTLLGLDENPAHLPGYGPVIAEIARKVINDQQESTWGYVVTDQGRPIATGTISRRPTTGMRRHLGARYHTCVFPGCRIPARQSDLDHTRPWNQDGPTRIANLAPLCRYHHQLKDHGWSYRIKADGAVEWTSPLGHHYTTGTDPPD
jgi:hypothetical protein